MSFIKQRLVEYAAFKGLSAYNFGTKNNLSNSFFSNQSQVGSDALLKIFRNYPELNFDWVITGRGEMLMSENSKKCANCEDFKEKYYSLLEKNQVLQEEAIGYLKQKEIIINQQ